MIANGSATPSSTAQAPGFGQPTQAVKWRFGHAWPPDSPGVKTFQAIFEEVRTRTGGLFTIETSAMTDRGFGQGDALRLIAQERSFDLIFHFPSYVAGDEPLFEAAIVPLHGLVDETDNARVMDVQREIAVEIAADWDLQFVSFQHVSGAEKRVYLFSKGPVRSIEDLKNVRLRHWSQLGADIFQSIGVAAQVIPASELTMALQDGTVDAAVFPANYAAAASLDEVTKYIAYITPFVASTPAGFLARKQTWAALPDEYKTVWMDVMNTHVQEDVASYHADVIEPQLLNDLEAKGMIILDPLPETDRRRLQEEALRQWRKNAENLGSRAVGYYRRIVADLGIATD